MDSNSEFNSFDDLLNISEFQKIFGHVPGRDKYMIKLALVGYPGTGKTAFVKRFCDQIFPPNHMPSMNIEITSEVIRVANSMIVEVFLYEVAGQTQYIDLKELFVCGVQGIIVMFAPHYEYSFNRLGYLIDFIDRHMIVKVPKLVVANYFEGLDRIVSSEKAAEFCNKIGCDFCMVDVKRNAKSVDKCVGYFINKLIEGVEL